MSNLIKLDICLSDIPKNKIRKGTNGKLYISLLAGPLKQPDRYKNDYYVAVSQTRDERDSNEARVFVGNGQTLGTAQRVDEMELMDDTDPAPWDSL